MRIQSTLLGYQVTLMSCKDITLCDVFARLAPLSAGFQSLPLLPTIKLGPSGADSQVIGLVHALGP